MHHDQAYADIVTRPCVVCGEETLNGRLCRDCGIDEAFSHWSRCPCGSLIFNPTAVEKQPHAPTCPHEETGAYDPQPETPQPDPIQAAYARGYRAGLQHRSKPDAG